MMTIHLRRRSIVANARNSFVLIGASPSPDVWGCWPAMVAGSRYEVCKLIAVLRGAARLGAVPSRWAETGVRRAHRRARWDWRT